MKEVEKDDDLLVKMQNFHQDSNEIEINEDEWQEDWNGQVEFEHPTEEPTTKEIEEDEEKVIDSSNVKEIHYHKHYTINILGLIFQK